MLSHYKCIKQDGRQQLIPMMNMFQKNSNEILRKMQDLEEFCDVTLVTEDNKRIRAHKVVLASASSIFRDLFQTDEENTEYEVIRLRGVSSNFIVSMVDLVYNRE